MLKFDLKYVNTFLCQIELLFLKIDIFNKYYTLKRGKIHIRFVIGIAVSPCS